MAVPSIIYKLECGHNASAPMTLVSGKLYCPWHDELSPISGVVVEEWQVTCQTCRYARWTGLSRESATLLANGHIRRNSWHRPSVRLAVNPNARITWEKLTSWSNSHPRHRR